MNEEQLIKIAELDNLYKACRAIYRVKQAAWQDAEFLNTSGALTKNQWAAPFIEGNKFNIRYTNDANEYAAQLRALKADPNFARVYKANAGATPFDIDSKLADVSKARHTAANRAELEAMRNLKSYQYKFNKPDQYDLGRNWRHLKTRARMGMRSFDKNVWQRAKSAPLRHLNYGIGDLFTKGNRMRGLASMGTGAVGAYILGKGGYNGGKWLADKIGLGKDTFWGNALGYTGGTLGGIAGFALGSRLGRGTYNKFHGGKFFG